MAHSKPITSQGAISTTNSAPFLSKRDFEALIGDHGYDVSSEKAIRCACRNKVSGQALNDCQNCQGTGWVFINKRAFRAVIQNINQSTKFKNWTEDDRGTISITALASDKLSFMDKIVVPEVEALFSEVLYLRLDIIDGIWFGFLNYPTISVEHAFLWKSSTEKLIDVTEAITIEHSLLRLDPADLPGVVLPQHVQVSIRYTHHPAYNIIDENRTMVKSRQTDGCSDIDGFSLKNLPLNYIARKTHFLFEKPDFEGNSVFDNSTT